MIGQLINVGFVGKIIMEFLLSDMGSTGLTDLFWILRRGGGCL